MTTIIEQFIADYEKRFDYYEKACLIAKDICDTLLRSEGIKAIVSARAKSPDRLRAKLIQRNASDPYTSIDSIYSDIPDLAGVRLALYFPSQIYEASRLVEDRFTVEKLKNFPKDSNRDSKKSDHEYVFSGYAANHHRVFIKDEELSGPNVRFRNCRIEIQIASVLMHAWSEVEHDLVYKELNGEVSRSEVEIIDEVNGIVLVGEMALKRLFKAQNDRKRSQEKPFRNHFDMASYLHQEIASSVGTSIKMGDVERLYQILDEAKSTDMTAIRRYILNVKEKIGKGSIPADSTIAGLLLEESATENPDLNIKMAEGRVSDEGVLQFLSAFASAQRQLFRFTSSPKTMISEMKKRKLLSELDIELFAKAQNLRNQIAHGRTEQIAHMSLNKASFNDLMAILQKIEKVIEDNADDLWALNALKMKGPLDRMASKFNQLHETIGNLSLAFETDDEKREFRVVASGQVCIGEDANGKPIFQEIDFKETEWKQTPDKAWIHARLELENEFQRLRSKLNLQAIGEPDPEDDL